jgi:hypothetical protein
MLRSRELVSGTNSSVHVSVTLKIQMDVDLRKLRSPFNYRFATNRKRNTFFYPWALTLLPYLQLSHARPTRKQCLKIWRKTVPCPDDKGLKRTARIYTSVGLH